jgi:hypothetical protein
MDEEPRCVASRGLPEATGWPDRSVAGLYAALLTLATAATPLPAAPNDEAAAISSDFEAVLSFACGGSPLASAEKQRVAQETAAALRSAPIRPSCAKATTPCAARQARARSARFSRGEPRVAPPFLRVAAAIGCGTSDRRGSRPDGRLRPRAQAPRDRTLALRVASSLRLDRALARDPRARQRLYRYPACLRTANYATMPDARFRGMRSSENAIVCVGLVLDKLRVRPERETYREIRQP